MAIINFGQKEHKVDHNAKKKKKTEDICFLKEENSTGCDLHIDGFLLEWASCREEWLPTL